MHGILEEITYGDELGKSSVRGKTYESFAHCLLPLFLQGASHSIDVSIDTQVTDKFVLLFSLHRASLLPNYRLRHTLHRFQLFHIQCLNRIYSHQNFTFFHPPVNLFFQIYLILRLLHHLFLLSPEVEIVFNFVSIVNRHQDFFITHISHNPLRFGFLSSGALSWLFSH